MCNKTKVEKLWCHRDLASGLALTLLNNFIFEQLLHLPVSHFPRLQRRGNNQLSIIGCGKKKLKEKILLTGFPLCWVQRNQCLLSLLLHSCRVKLSSLRVGYYKKSLLGIWTRENGNFNLPGGLHWSCPKVSYVRVMPFAEKWNVREIGVPMCGNAESFLVVHYVQSWKYKLTYYFLTQSFTLCQTNWLTKYREGHYPLKIRNKKVGMITGIQPEKEGAGYLQEALSAP